VVTAGSCPARR